MRIIHNEREEGRRRAERERTKKKSIVKFKVMDESMDGAMDEEWIQFLIHF